MDVEEAPVPVIAVTAAVGAVVLLLVLFCSVVRKQDSQEKKEEGRSRPWSVPKTKLAIAFT